MRIRWLFVMSALLLVASGVWGDDAKPKPGRLPQEAMNARREFEEAVRRADSDRDSKVREARDVLAKRLEAVVKSETRKGNLDAAVAVREVLQDLSAFGGTWLITWSIDRTFQFELRGDSVAAYEVGSKAELWTVSKVVRKGGTLSFRKTGGGHDELYRLRRAGDYLIAELWRGSNDGDPQTPPTLVGIGRRSS